MVTLTAVNNLQIIIMAIRRLHAQRQPASKEPFCSTGSDATSCVLVKWQPEPQSPTPEALRPQRPQAEVFLVKTTVTFLAV